MVSELKKELMNFIEKTNDEALLHLVKEDFLFYSKREGADITDDLTEEQLKELQELADEAGTKDIQTLDEFKKATDRRRLK